MRGVLAGFKKYGYKIGGFDATTASRVIAGSGLSSSAAYEAVSYTHLDVYKRQVWLLAVVLVYSVTYISLNNKGVAAVSACLFYTSRCV